MERNMFNVSFTDHNPMSINGMSNMFTCPLIQPDVLDPNSQSQIMVSYPFLPTWNGEAVYGHNLMNHVGINDSEASVSTSMPFHNTDFQQHFMGGTTLSATSLANLLSTRTGLHGNLNELQVDQYRDSVSNNCYNNSNSSNTNSVNRGFGLQEGMEFLESEKDARMNSQLEARWDFSKFLGPPEFSGRSSLRTVGDLYSYNTPSNELSLTLSTQPNINVQNISDQCSEISCSGVTHDDSMRKIGLSSKPITSNCRDLSLGFGSRQPIQFSHLLSGSKYLRAVQQILTEIASQSVRNQDFQTWFDPNVSLSSRFTTELGSSVTGSGPFPSLAGETTSKDQMDFTLEIQNSESKKSQLLTLLQLVDSRYNQCLDEIHTVVSAFHAATELDPQIHASFALQTVCHLYKSVRKRIASQILKTGELLTNDYSSENSSFESSFIQKQWALQQLKKKDHQPWRPQRGLPEKSVSILRAWLFQNFLHPYPRDTEKHLLSIRSGLTRNQVSNWFINARVRLWKPMIEEMYTEMNNRNGYQTDNRTNDGDGSNYINIDNNQSLRVNYSDGNY